MCGIRECLGLLQYVTSNKASKYDNGKDDDVSLGPRPVKKQNEKWNVDGGEKGDKGERR